MKNFLFYTFILISLSLFSQESKEENDSVILSSKEAEYDGKEFSLTGDVIIQHEIGRIAAQHLTLVPAKSGNKKMKCSDIRMQRDIVLDLYGGGQLYCQQAEIDCLHLQASFLGSSDQLDVVYIDTRKKNETTVPLMIKSFEVKAELMRQKDESKNADRTAVRYIQAEGNVRAYYNQEYTILADKALYQRISSENSSAGMLFLNAIDSSQRPCEVSNRNGDQVKSDQIRVNTLKRQIICSNPKGSLYFNTEKQPRQLVHFVCRQLVWDDIKQQLILQKEVEVEQPGFGKITTPHEIQVIRHTVQGAKIIQSIFSPEETELTYIDNEKKIVHKLICHGPLTIDHRHLQAILQSHPDSQGQIAQNRQVYFEDIMGDIYADCMQLHYETAQHRLIPSKITMTGHVKIYNRFDGHVQESSSVLQYALADIVEYYPKSKEMILTGQNGQRVLFYDKVNNVQMSAPTLKIKRDQEHPTGLIQGSGDVRFTFFDKEFNQLRQHFEVSKEEH